MMRTNQRPKKSHTHEGAPAKHISPASALRRAVLSCLLFEKEFYEDGEDIASRIMRLASECDFDTVAGLAVEAREHHGLRHVPLLLLLDLIGRGNGKNTAAIITAVISRPDELCELLALYWRDGRKPLAKALKNGLASAFNKFNEYQFAKWNRPNAIKLRDVMFLTHPKPKDAAQAEVFKKLAEDGLAVPDTWESRLVSGQDKREVFEDLLSRGKLGYIALLKNLRGMLEVGVSDVLIGRALREGRSQGVLPYQFVAAAQYGGPRLEPLIEEAMLKNLTNRPQLDGRTVLLVDVSGSMRAPLSHHGTMTRMDAACGLAILLASQCQSLRVFTFSEELVEVAPRQGFALRDGIVNSQRHWSTYLGRAVKTLFGIAYDRLIVITDEQSHDTVPDPHKGLNYLINVASYQRGVGYGPWTHIDGFSQSVVDWLIEYEAGSD